MPTRTLPFLVLTAVALAQSPDTKTLTGSAQQLQNQIRTNIERAAEKMPEENYSFKPTPDVRSFGELVGHVANAQYSFCSAALGEKSPSSVNLEKTKTAKADLVAALQEAFAYCNKAYAGTNDSNMGQAMKLFGAERARLGILSFNTAHNNEHYGNMVTYMRLKNIVPPSSEPRK